MRQRKLIVTDGVAHLKGKGDKGRRRKMLLFHFI